MRKRTVELVRETINQISENTIAESIEALASSALGKTYARFGWHCRCSHQHKPEGNPPNRHTYTATLTFSKNQERERDNSDEVFGKQFEVILDKLTRTGRSRGWLVPGAQPDEQTKATVSAELAKNPETSHKQDFNVPLPSNLMPHFGHIFDREAHIRIVQNAIESAVASGFKRRSHCLLYGSPGCGKSEILLAYEKMLGSDYVVKLDATMTSKAGAENVLMEYDTIPPVIIIEEIEKTAPQNLSWMLGIMDSRGEILKTNARIGSIRKAANCLVLATANDLGLLNSILAGALSSRFQHKLYCPRPSREILHKILSREVAKMNGKPEWIEPCLDFCLNVEKTNDPRRFIAVLDGKDRLLDGSYQRDFLAIRASMEADGVSY